MILKDQPDWVYIRRLRCRATTLDGYRCEKAADSDGWCPLHQPDDDFLSHFNDWSPPRLARSQTPEPDAKLPRCLAEWADVIDPENDWADRRPAVAPINELFSALTTLLIRSS